MADIDTSKEADLPKYRLIGHDAGMEPSKTGHWVSVSDYAALSRDLEAMRAERADAIARAEQAEERAEEWHKAALGQWELADSTAMRVLKAERDNALNRFADAAKKHGRAEHDRDAALARVAELEAALQNYVSLDLASLGRAAIHADETARAALLREGGE